MLLPSDCTTICGSLWAKQSEMPMRIWQLLAVSSSAAFVRSIPVRSRFDGLNGNAPAVPAAPAAPPEPPLPAPPPSVVPALLDEHAAEPKPTVIAPTSRIALTFISLPPFPEAEWLSHGSKSVDVRRETKPAPGSTSTGRCRARKGMLRLGL